MSKNRTKEQYQSIAWHKRQHAPSEELRSFSGGERSTTDRLREERKLSHHAGPRLFTTTLLPKRLCYDQRSSTKIQKPNTNSETEKPHIPVSALGEVQKPDPERAAQQQWNGSSYTHVLSTHGRTSSAEERGLPRPDSPESSQASPPGGGGSALPDCPLGLHPPSTG